MSKQFDVSSKIQFILMFWLIFGIRGAYDCQEDVKRGVLMIQGQIGKTAFLNQGEGYSKTSCAFLFSTSVIRVKSCPRISNELCKS